MCVIIACTQTSIYGSAAYVLHNFVEKRSIVVVVGYLQRIDNDKMMYVIKVEVTHIVYSVLDSVG